MKTPNGWTSRDSGNAKQKTLKRKNLRLLGRSIMRLLPHSRASVTALVGAAVLVAALSGLILSRTGSVIAFAPAITTYLSDCTTPQTNYSLGVVGQSIVCAKVTGASFFQRLVWVDPSGVRVRISPFITDSTFTDSFQPPSVGSWTLILINVDGDAIARTGFVVRDPANFNADLSVVKWTSSSQALAGGNVLFRVYVTNLGPDPAANVVLTDQAPANTTFFSETQDSGPAFDCSITGDTCTINSLTAGETALFSFIYTIDSGVPVGTIISNTASAASDTAEIRSDDNSASAHVTVSGVNTAPCSILCPTDITKDNDPNLCTAVAVYVTPTSSGNCVDPDTGQASPVTCNPPSGTPFPIGVTAVTCGTGATTCSFTVTVSDTRSPSTPAIACPADVTVNENPAGTGSATVNYGIPTATGNCVTISCSPPSGSQFLAGTTTVNCTATDSSNNTAPCSFTVTVNTTTCRLDCPDDKTVSESSAGSGSAIVTYTTATTVGTCPALTIACSPPSGNSFPVGLTLINCTATDGSNNIFTTCSFSITVNSLPACSITCPANVSVSESSPGSGSATVSYSPTTTGNCSGPPPVSCSPATGAVFPIGTTTVHCNGTDPAGITSTCSFTVTVTGGTPCTITCPGNILDSSDGGGCGKVVTYPDPITSGSCGDPNDPNNPNNPNHWTCNPASGSFFPVGSTAVVCSTDVGTQCSFTVTITGTDTTLPVIISCAPARSASADSTCQAVVPNFTSDVEATDTCTPAELLTITQTPAAGSLVGTGPTTITLTVRDASNNSSTCTTTFTVSEPIPPTALCKSATVFLDATGNASVGANDVDNGSTDNCGIASRTVSPSTFTCANKGPNTVTLTVTDPSGNSASCQATVTVVDNTPPTISCPANVVQSTDPNQCTAVVTYSNATATDNCPGVGTPACSPASGSTFPKGTTTVNCSVSDASSNSASCSFTVTVNDTQAPAITCPASQTREPTCPTGAVATYTAPVGTDNCPGQTTARTAGPASGSVFPIGTTTVTYTVTDASNNSTSCSFTVTVLTPQAVIQNMLNSVAALSPPLSAQQSQGLASKLQAALDAVNAGKTNVACNKLSDFISQLTGFIGNGTLTSAQGQPLLNSAANVRNTLGCTNLGCS